MTLTRRSLLKAAALTTACTTIGPVDLLSARSSVGSDQQFHGLRVGVASYCPASAGNGGSVRPLR